MTVGTVDDRITARPQRSEHRLSTGRCAITGHLVSITSLFPSSDVLEQWRELASRALVPNLFYEPEFAQAASLAFGKNVKLLTISTTENGQTRMLLAWPYRVVRQRWGIPLHVMVGWTHPFASLGVPLVDADHAESALRALLNSRSIFTNLPPRALLPLIPEEGPIGQILARLDRERGGHLAFTERHDRAYWRRGEADDPLATLSSGTKSKLRQEFRRLERDGRVTHEIITDSSEMSAALEDYLALEASGWKARAGTAIPQSENETTFMRQLVRELAAQGRIRIDRLRLGGSTLASSITYLSSARHAWYAKISYNEDYAKNSPGSQLVLKVTEDFRVNTDIAYADSCAPPSHPLMRKFWSTRFYLSNMMVRLGTDPMFPLAARLEAWRPTVRDSVRRLVGQLRRKALHLG